MISIENPEKFNWIFSYFENYLSVENPTISGLMPDLFENYIKILHPMYIRKSILKPEYKRIRWNEVCKICRVPFPDEIYGYYVSQALKRRIKYKIYKPDDKEFIEGIGTVHRMWPKDIIGPAEDSIELYQLAHLMKIFMKSGCENFYYYYNWFKLHDYENCKDLLYSGSGDEILQIMEDERIPQYDDNKYTPCYIWNEKRNFCLCTHYDYDYTVIGCSDRILDLLLSNPVLECIQVNPDTGLYVKDVNATLNSHVSL